MKRQPGPIAHGSASTAFHASGAAEILEATGRRALAANGFGDAIVEPLRPMRPIRPAPGRSLFEVVATVAAAALGTAGAALRARLHRWRALQQAEAAGELDAAALRDLGVARGELSSIAFEAADLAERTRRRLAL